MIDPRIDRKNPQNRVILVYSGNRSGGLAKGVVAVAHALNRELSVEIIALRYQSMATGEITATCVAGHSFLRRVSIIRDYLRESKSNIVISFGLYSDFLLFLSGQAGRSSTYIRSNLKGNYTHDHGRIAGTLRYWLHVIIIRRFKLRLVLFSDHTIYPLGTTAVLKNVLDERDIYSKVYPQGYFADQSEFHKKVFVFIGSLTERKGIRELLVVLRDISVLNLRYQPKLLILGSGHLESYLKQYVAVNALDVRFFGEVDNVFNILQSADYFLLPSFSEGTSRAALESLFIGVPIIVRAIDGNSELVNDGKNGWIFRTNFELNSLLVDICMGRKEIVKGTFRYPSAYTTESFVNDFKEIFRENLNE